MVMPAGDLDAAEPRQMVGQELGVEQAITARPQQVHQMHQRHIARISLAAEHALAKKRRADRHTIEPADKGARAPKTTSG